jgi:hypothetical protein
MKKTTAGFYASLMLGSALGLSGAAAAETTATPDSTAADVASDQATPAAAGAPAATPAPAAPATIKDSSLGTSVIGRFFNYQAAEWGLAASPLETDPNAPPSRRTGWSPAPTTQPPYPFTEWSYGGTTLLGVNRPNSVDSPLMVALADSRLGRRRRQPVDQPCPPGQPARSL